MVFNGTLDIGPSLAHAPRMPNLSTEPLELENVEIVQLVLEIDDDNMEALIPPALHPTIPPTVHFIGMKVPGGPLGAFALVQVRVGCRAGVRPRGYTTMTYCDSESAGRALAERWGFPVRPGEIHLRRLYDRVTLRVDCTAQGRVLDAELVDPLPISGFDVQYLASLNLARVDRDGRETPRLIQVDPDYTIRRADRGTADLLLFDPEAWSAEGVEPTYPIVGSYTVADVKLPKLRYIMDPRQSALTGTETL